MCSKMRKSLGNKRNELTAEHIDEITRIYEGFVASDVSKILPNAAFGYRKVTVERPLRLRWDLTADTIAAALDTKSIRAIDPADRDAVRTALKKLDGTSYATLAELEKALKPVLASASRLSVPARKALTAAFAVRDLRALPVLDTKGQPEPDTDLRDTENVPLDEDVAGFIGREVLPFAPDAWVDSTKTKVGYEIPFTRQFYRYVPPRPLAEIDAEIKASQQRILKLLAEVTE
jgi:type I restriction enzyme M protein